MRNTDDRLRHIEGQLEKLRDEFQAVVRLGKHSGTRTNEVVGRVTASASPGVGTVNIQDFASSADVDSATTQSVVSWPRQTNAAVGNHVKAKYSLLRQQWEITDENRLVAGQWPTNSATATGVVGLIGSGSNHAYSITEGTNAWTVDADQAGVYWASLTGKVSVAASGDATLAIRVNSTAKLTTQAVKAAGGTTTTFPICVSGSLGLLAAGDNIEVHLTKSGTVTFSVGFFSVMRI